ncbi:MAG: Unknown protein [uncultured Sulfurovum sp.]|uniref:Uncharacterized protein n=1 Tax=uncultured Sulfurovum sp. TaxID=269237 RepID=A0A6S6T6K8_9BACT|nr:MAG: Unknown protein [uncultured Sulfurovum sp.]
MQIRTFFFLLFITTSALFFLSTFQPAFTLEVCGSMCTDELSSKYIELTSMSMSAIALLLFVTTNHYTEKRILKKKEKEAMDRLNIEQIHAELEALK